MRFSLHIGWNRAKPNNCKTIGATSIICAPSIRRPPDSPTVSWSEKKNAVLRVVGPVWPRVIFEGVYFSAANCANGAPVKTAEINDQIRRHAAHLFVKFLRPVNLRADVASVFIRNCFQPGDQFVAHLFVILRARSYLPARVQRR